MVKYLCNIFDYVYDPEKKGSKKNGYKKRINIKGILS